MSCGCKKSLSNHNGSTSCNCCTPAPPCNPPICNNPEPCDVAIDSQCVIYTGGDLQCIGLDAGTPPIIRLDEILETLDAAICQADIGATFVEDTDCIVTTGVGSQADPLVISPIISDAVDNILECTPDGLYVPAPPAPTPVITANNGLTKTLNNIQLGGALIIPTTVTTDVTNTLSITGLSTDATPDFYLTETNAGVVKKIGSATVATNVLGVLTANNGLTKTGTNIQLGGSLIQNTDVDLDGYNLSFLDNVATPTGIIIYTGSPNETSYVTNTTLVEGKLKVNGKTFLDGNVGIGVTPYNSSDLSLPINTNNAKLFVARSSGFRNSSLTTASDHLLEFSLAGTETANIIAGLTGRINLAPTANITMLGGSRIAAIYGYMQYTGTFNINNQLRNSLTGVFGQCSFSSGGLATPTGGDVDYVIALRAGRPLHVASNYYGGTIENAYGLYIEDQRDDIDDTVNRGYITNSYGIYQEGITDENVFRSSTNVFSNLPTYANEVAATAGGLTTGTIYKTATGELRIKL